MKLVFPLLKNASPTVDLTRYIRDNPDAGLDVLREALAACEAAGVQVVVEGAEPGQTAEDAILDHLDQLGRKP
jgi:hypothetical protein